MTTCRPRILPLGALQALIRNRRFSLPIGLGKVISKPILFSLSNSWAKFRQVDTLRSHEHAKKEF